MSAIRQEFITSPVMNRRDDYGLGGLVAYG